VPLSAHFLRASGTELTYVRAFRDLHLCQADGTWRKAGDIAGCRASTYSTTAFLETAVCTAPGAYAVLQLAADKCDDEGFVRQCHVCVEGWYGCLCEFRSTNVNTGSSTVRGLAYAIASLYLTAAITRFLWYHMLLTTTHGAGSEASAAHFFQNRWTTLTFLLYLALAACLVLKVYYGDQYRHETHLATQDFDTLRTLAGLLVPGTFILLLMAPNLLQTYARQSLHRALGLLLVLAVALAEAGAHIMVLVAGALPVMAAHRHVGVVPPVWTTLTVTAPFFVFAQLVMWPLIYRDPARVDGLLARWVVLFFCLFAVPVVVCLYITGIRLPCE
jgi:hypothetical protein